MLSRIVYILFVVCLSRILTTESWLAVEAKSLNDEKGVDNPSLVIQNLRTKERDHDDETKYFTCTNKGRYPDLNDSTCQKYLFCILLRNGSFGQISYTCPTTSCFNPLKQVCDVAYKCPCISTNSSGVLTTTTTVKPTTENEITISVMTEKATTESETSSVQTISTPSSAATTTEVRIFT
ncbi:hypothetical protein JTB14_012267 [Gonioctena quinquepunctata]|nr:hypothetical protein JTB14_012267 [Gonioctena quinquepunctata]